MATTHEGPGSRETLAHWLGRRNPGVPEAFLPHLVSEEVGVFQGPRDLMSIGTDAIRQALASPGRNREAAFRLLAGDAFLTYACEAVAEDEGDPGAALEALLSRVGERFR